MAEYRVPTKNSNLTNLPSTNQPINRESVPRDDETVLIDYREELTKQIVPAHILNSLFQRRVIDSDDFDSIKQEERQNGRRAGVEKLLYRIHFSGPEGLDKFVDSLKSSGYPGLANRLQESRQIITKRTEHEKANRPCVERKSNYSHRIEITEKDAAAEPTTNDTRCIILFGKSGIGKSSLGNYLLGSQKFRTSLILDGRTKVCQIEFKDHMVVMDTPGFFSRFRSDLKVAREIKHTLILTDLLINVYILVLSANDIESGDGLKSVEFIKKLFGENVIDNMVIVVNGVFDHGDEELQFLRCLPQIPYCMLDCKHGKQVELEEIRKEIFSHKYNNIPDVFNIEDVDGTSIEREDSRRKQSEILDVDNFMDSVLIRLRLTQTGGNSRLKRNNSSVKEITEKCAASEPTTNDKRCIIVLGKSGVVKSSFGNSLLGAQRFGKGIYGTEIFEIVRTDQMVVMNTPGFLPNLQSEESNANEILNTIRENDLLINVYILVLDVEEGLSGDEIESVEVIKEQFGENVINNMIIVLLKDDEFQFLRYLPQIPLFILDCEHGKQEEVEKIRKEIFSEKYKNIPDVSDVEDVDWVSIEDEERRRKNKCVLS